MTGYSHYFLHGIRRSKFGRTPGGVSVFVRENISDYVTFTSKTDYGLVFRLNKDFFRLNKDILFVCAYVPNDGSTFYDTRDEKNGINDFEYMLTNLIVDNEISQCDILLTGDLNARTANNLDYIISDNVDFIPDMNWYPAVEPTSGTSAKELSDGWLASDPSKGDREYTFKYDTGDSSFTRLWLRMYDLGNPSSTSEGYDSWRDNTGKFWVRIEPVDGGTYGNPD